MMRIVDRRDLVDGHGAGSRKYLLAVGEDGVGVECAFLVREDRHGLCASAQAGCSFACRHCATTYAPRRFLRNLLAAEIVEMVGLVVEDANQGRSLDFLDFSGVGDCSANWDAVRDACLEAGNRGLARSHRVTTVAPRAWCRRVAREIGVGIISPERIVISLHGADQATRRFLIPGAEDPWQAAACWRDLKSERGSVDLNYVVHQLNSGLDHARRLVDFVCAQADWVRELRLSTVNAVPGMDLFTPDHFPEFAASVRAGVPARVRMNRFTSVGRSLAMACGQMRALRQGEEG